MATADQVGSTVDEYAQANASTRQAKALDDFADKPLIVLTAGIGSNAAWLAAQDEMATISTNSVHRVIAGATHASLVETEQDAAAVTRAIHDVVGGVRTDTPLGSLDEQRR